MDGIGGNAGREGIRGFASRANGRALERVEAIYMMAVEGNNSCAFVSAYE